MGEEFSHALTLCSEKKFAEIALAKSNEPNQPKQVTLTMSEAVSERSEWRLL